MAVMTRVDPELGTVKLCPDCGRRDPGGNAWWPLDEDFWYHDNGSAWASICRACWVDRNADRRAAMGRPRTDRLTGRSSDLLAVRAAERAAYARLSPEQKQARVDARRAWRHARSAAKCMGAAYADAKADA